MKNTIKCYGKTLNTWTHMVTVTTRNGNQWEEERPSQYEIAYREYMLDTGELIAKGSEDFSPERRRSSLKRYRIYSWDGIKRNAGGNRWFTEEMQIEVSKATKKADVAKLVKMWLPAAAVIELR